VSEADSLELKPISQEAVAEAIAKAEHYRLLNEPEQAESVCLDVFEVEPSNQRNLTCLVLAMSDQLGSPRGARRKEIESFLLQLEGEYQAAYYRALLAERAARPLLDKGPSRVFAYDGLREAMELYERAAELRPAGNDDALLRWNSCLRTIRRERLEPLPESEPGFPLE
jgi:tetratricopeptide (TPR) repeat protein